MALTTEKEKMLSGELYNGFDPELVAERQEARRVCGIFNATAATDLPYRRKILTQLLGSCGEEPFIEPPFRCDYGYNIHIGKKFYANFDLIILDVCRVTIGDHCFCGPRVSIFAATHPLDAATRSQDLEYGKPVTIGDNVWIGGHAVINPGVTIGNNVVIASGAVVTRDVPDNVLVAGVPAKVIKTID